MAKQPKRLDVEWCEQVRLIHWADTHTHLSPHLNLLNASLNGARLPMGLAMKLKRSGMRKGYPDLFLPLPISPYHGLFIELKKPKWSGNSQAKPEQVQWSNWLNDLSYKTVISWGYHNAALELIDYLVLGSQRKEMAENVRELEILTTERCRLREEKEAEDARMRMEIKEEGKSKAVANWWEDVRPKAQL